MGIQNNGDGYAGFLQPEDTSTDFNAQSFLIWAILSKIHTATLVKVVKVTNAGSVSPVGFVDILPLVNQIDGNWNSEPHATIYKCPYFRLQGGTDAIILDPKVGDIGIALFADRDISTVTATKKQATPGSRRKFDMADGLYIGGVLNGVPVQWIEFSEAGINITSPTAISLNAPDVNINCKTFELNATTAATITTPTFTVNGATFLNGSLSQGLGAGGGAASMKGPVVVTNDVTAEGKSVATHTHNDPQGGTTGGPN